MIRRAHYLLLSLGLVTIPARAQEPIDEGTNLNEEEPEPAKGDGFVQGKILDKQTAQPLAGTSIDVVGTEVRVTTNDKGDFKISLPPGRYALRIYTPGYQPVRVQNVFVYAQGTRKLDVGLEPEAEASDDEFVIEAAPDSASIDALALERKRSASMGDSVGRAEMSKSPDRNAAAAAQRVVGVTLVGNRFVYVRGLGERYTNALLNGAPLPSPEPDRAAVPLDLFPTLALESLTVVKTFTPDSPGDFAGGSVRIETRRIPSKFLFQVSATGGFNTQSTFRERLDYQGGKRDWLGYDDGFRARPGDFPAYKQITPGTKPDGTDVTRDDLKAAGLSINSYLSTKNSFTPPDHSVSVVVGDGFKLGGDRKLGVVAALSYGRKYEIRTGEIDNQFSSTGTELQSERRYLIDMGRDTVNWGAFASVGYDFSKHHRLTLLGLHSQIADDSARVIEGFNVNRQATIHDTRLDYVTRSLNFGQLHGEHNFPELSDANVDWAAWLSGASRNQPDTRSIAWQLTEGAQNFTYVEDSTSGRHFWAEQSEKIIGGQLSWTQPVLEDSKLKFGGFLNRRTRDFTSRNMSFSRAPGVPISELGRYQCPSQDFNACADSLTFGGNIGPLLQLEESTLPSDAYNADLNVYAVYAMTDVAVTRWFRAIVGQRLEVTRQTLEPDDQFDTGAVIKGAKIESTDLLPSVGVVFDVTSKAKLRSSFTRTLARPQLRELAPFAYSSVFGGRPEVGNPDLSLTHISNADIRFEYFPTLKEVMALSVFYKRFSDPIENIVIAGAQNGTSTYQNAKGADLRGLELELRKSLGFLSDHLKHFSFISNLTVSVSNIDLEGKVREYVTSPSRPMVNQAPYSLNLAADYDAPTGTTVRLLYNVAGARIVQVGTLGLPDAYEHPRHLIDITAQQEIGKHFAVRATAANILNSPVVVTQGEENTDDNIVTKYTTGTVYSLGASYTY
jgi:hypothetical protein